MRYPTIEEIQSAAIALLVVSETAHWYKRYRWPSKFVSVRGKIAECSKCHKRVAAWQQKWSGVVCANCVSK